MDLESAFREAMAHVAAPVAVITTMVDGVPFGSTVSAFASLSVTPPMVVVALDDRGALVGRIRESGRLSINVLAADQAAVALIFATRGRTDRFATVEWTPDAGLPRLAGCSAWLRCDRVSFESGGDHTILLATVAAAETPGRDALTYYRRQFGSAAAAITPAARTVQD